MTPHLLRCLPAVKDFSGRVKGSDYNLTLNRSKGTPSICSILDVYNVKV